jgi:hypothetical protein
LQLLFLPAQQPQIHGQMSDGRSIFKNEAKSIKEHFTELNYEEDAQGSPAVVGDLVLRDDAGTVIDNYSIKIVASEGYPNRFPWVYETGGRIPINVDWHVFPDGHCCIKAIPEEILICKGHIALPRFIQEQVIPYFFNQKYRELHGFFLYERSHGALGTIEYFSDHFNTQNVNLILKLLREAQNTRELKSNSKCICGSGRKYRKCHRRSLRILRVFTKSGIKSFVESIQSLQDLTKTA